MNRVVYFRNLFLTWPQLSFISRFFRRSPAARSSQHYLFPSNPSVESVSFFCAAQKRRTNIGTWLFKWALDRVSDSVSSDSVGSDSVGLDSVGADSVGSDSNVFRLSGSRLGGSRFSWLRLKCVQTQWIQTQSERWLGGLAVITRSRNIWLWLTAAFRSCWFPSLKKATLGLPSLFLDSSLILPSLFPRSEPWGCWNTI